MVSTKPAVSRKLSVFHIDFNFVCLKPDYLKQWLEQLAGMGYSAILWELEDKVRWETCPECVWPEAMTKKEFADVLAFSRKLGLTPMPLLQTIGHGEYVLLHDHYKPFRELPDHHDCYCTSNPKVRKFLAAWIGEYVDLFGELEYFHLGGDEAYVFASCPKCSAHAAKHGKNHLYNQHINALAEPLMQKGIRPCIWHDMIMHDTGDIDQISRQFVIWYWNYFLHQPAHEEKLLSAVKTLTESKFDVVLCSASRSGGDNFFCPAYRHADNVAMMARTAVRKDLLGNCVTSWAIRLNDYIVQIPYAAIAECAMARPDSSTDEILRGCCRQLFGVDAAPFIEAMKTAGLSMPFAKNQTSAVQWNNLKDSLPAPPGYLRDFLEKEQAKKSSFLTEIRQAVDQCLADLPKAIATFSDFFARAAKGHEIIEHWLTGANLLLQRALIADRVLRGEKDDALVRILQRQKNEYAAFLERYQIPRSARKNADLVFDALIDFFS